MIGVKFEEFSCAKAAPVSYCDRYEKQMIAEAPQLDFRHLKCLGAVQITCIYMENIHACEHTLRQETPQTMILETQSAQQAAELILVSFGDKVSWLFLLKLS